MIRTVLKTNGPGSKSVQKAVLPAATHLLFTSNEKAKSNQQDAKRLPLGIISICIEASQRSHHPGITAVRRNITNTDPGSRKLTTNKWHTKFSNLTTALSPPRRTYGEGKPLSGLPCGVTKRPLHVHPEGNTAPAKAQHWFYTLYRSDDSPLTLLCADIKSMT